MRQIILAIDGADVNMKALDFACFFARATNSTLIAAPLHTHEEKELEPASTTPGVRLDVPMFKIEGNGDILSRSRCQMSEACANRGITLEYVQDDPIDLADLIKESRFSDLIITDASTSFEKIFEGAPTNFLKHLLARTECPVIVAPESFDSFEEIVFAYDGSEASMFAMRQFTYLFPEFKNRKLTVLEVADEKDRSFTEKERLHRWLENYYGNIHYELLYGKPKDELFGHLLESQGKIVVMGAFGRTMLSMLASKSNADLILKAVNLPVFISHS